MHLQGLADSFLELHEVSQDISDLDTASLHYKNSFKISAAIPIDSWYAALRWAAAAEKHRSAYGLDAYSTVFELLPQILWIGNPLGVRQTEARRIDLARITSDAVCGCIENSNLILGVELLEQGLATTFQQMLELKPDVTMLSEADATRLQHMSTELYTDHAEHPRKLANERDKLLSEIRKHPGSEYFLRPKPYKSLREASKNGPIVMLNSHARHCDALAILNPKSDPVHIPFPKVTVQDLEDQRLILNDVLLRCNVRSRQSDSSRLFGAPEGFTSKPTEQCFAELLAWLWTDIVAHVYEALKSVGLVFVLYIPLD
jgi:hypothetical protein